MDTKELCDLIARCALRREGDHLFAPAGRVTDADRPVIDAHASELLALLAPEPDHTVPFSSWVRDGGGPELPAPKPAPPDAPPAAPRPEPEPLPVVAIRGARHQMTEQDIVACLAPLGDEVVAAYRTGKLPRTEAIAMTAVYLRAAMEMEVAELNHTFRRFCL